MICVCDKKKWVQRRFRRCVVRTTTLLAGADVLRSRRVPSRSVRVLWRLHWAGLQRKRCGDGGQLVQRSRSLRRAHSHVRVQRRALVGSRLFCSGAATRFCGRHSAAMQLEMRRPARHVHERHVCVRARLPRTPLWHEWAFVIPSHIHWQSIYIFWKI